MSDASQVQQQYALAVAHHHGGRLQEALAIYQQILAENPDHPHAMHMLGVALHQRGDHAAAEAWIRQAIALNPNSAMYLGNLASALCAQGKFAEAISILRSAIQMDPAPPVFHYNLGVALLHTNELDSAIASFQQAILLRPDYPQAHNNLGNALRTAGRLDEALVAHRQALSTRPDYAEATLNVALVLLLQGKLAEAWPLYEARWDASQKSVRRQYAQPLWDGAELAGRRILIYAEQGYGDVIQMIRYLPLVAARGGRIILQCQPPLRRLLANHPHLDQIISEGEPLSPFDVHCPMMSLPRMFGTTLKTIPANVPYIHADPALAEIWKQRVQWSAQSLEVGLVWSGKPMPPGRSIPPDKLAPLSDIPNVRFHNLQVRDGSSMPASHPLALPAIDHADELHDFADTAALLCNLDLLISIDTAAAHLAGAMGKPVWVVLPYSPDWRWMLGRHDSPWYPTMRLFRQVTAGQWGEPLAKVQEDLRALARARL